MLSVNASSSEIQPHSCCVLPVVLSDFHCEIVEWDLIVENVG